VKRLVSPVTVVSLVAAAALIGLLIYGVVSKEPDQGLDRAVLRGERPPAPALTLPGLGGGESQTLAAYRGQVVLVNYWASWCPPCREESPLLERMHQRMKRQGGTVLGVDVLDATSDAQAFIREKGLTYPMLKDAEGVTPASFGIVGYPESFLIDRQGRIAAIERGPIDETYFDRAVKPLLEEPA